MQHMNKNKIVALLIWNLVLLFIGLIWSLSVYQTVIMFVGAWAGVLCWEGFEIRKWLFS